MQRFLEYLRSPILAFGPLVRKRYYDETQILIRAKRTAEHWDSKYEEEPDPTPPITSNPSRSFAINRAQAKSSGGMSDGKIVKTATRKLIRTNG
jgi:hypothetical protein